MDIKQLITDLAQKAAAAEGCQVVSLQVKGPVGQQKIVLLADSDEGISIDQCAAISKQIGDELEAGGHIDTAYVLEVSSPGLDQPLTQWWQYKRNLGRKLKVTLLDGKEREGKMTEVAETHIVLEAQGKPGKIKKEDKVVSIPFEQIKESKVQVSFN